VMNDSHLGGTTPVLMKIIMVAQLNEYLQSKSEDNL
jgi:hypothetical protein